jgi:hypothetical protein
VIKGEAEVVPSIAAAGSAQDGIVNGERPLVPQRPALRLPSSLRGGWLQQAGDGAHLGPHLEELGFSHVKLSLASFPFLLPHLDCHRHSVPQAHPNLLAQVGF